MFVDEASMLTEVDISDSGYVYISSSDGHTGTTSHRTVQWLDIFHWNSTVWNCKHNNNIPITVFVILIINQPSNQSVNEFNSIAAYTLDYIQVNKNSPN